MESPLRLLPLECTQANSHHEQNKIQTVTVNLTQCDCLYPCPFHITSLFHGAKPPNRFSPKSSIYSILFGSPNAVKSSFKTSLLISLIKINYIASHISFDKNWFLRFISEITSFSIWTLYAITPCETTQKNPPDQFYFSPKGTISFRLCILCHFRHGVKNKV